MQDWIDDIARFSNDAVINGWFVKVKIVLQAKSQEVVAQHGWTALFQLMDKDSSGDLGLTCAEFTAALRSPILHLT